MNLRDFRQAGHWPTLACAFLYFDISFMCWVLISAVAISITKDFGLDAQQKYFMVSVPLLAGALLRLAVGVLADHIGARRTGMLGLLLTMVPLVLGFAWVDSYPRMLLVGVMLGVAGASFAAALPLASRWYPPRYQGIAMGIAGAGNSGSALALFFGPRLVAWMKSADGLDFLDRLTPTFGSGLANCWGWHMVFALALVPVLLTLSLFTLFAKDSPSQPPPKSLADYGAVLKQRDTWWFCLFYSVTFGGFVGLGSFLTLFFGDRFGVSEVAAGTFATLCVIAGSFLRPLGGYLADRFGGIRMLMLLYAGVGVTMLGMAALPSLALGVVLMFVTMGMLGMGNGSVFQLVPQRFPREIGVLTGIVGAAGGVGGFFLPNLLGSFKNLTGTFSLGFVSCALVGFACAAAVMYVSRSWEGVFVGQGGRAAGTAPAAAETALAPAEAEASA